MAQQHPMIGFVVGLCGLVGLLVWLGLHGRGAPGPGGPGAPEQLQSAPEAAGAAGRAGPAWASRPPGAHLLECYECTVCHRVTTPDRLMGPSLWQIRERADAAAIRAALLTPDAVVVPGYPAGLMGARLQQLGFYADIARSPALLERIVAALAGEPLAPSTAASTEAPGAGRVHIPAGRVRLPMGQEVAVPAFAIDAAPITNAQYTAFMAAGGYTTKCYWARTGWAEVVQRRHRTQPRDWRVTSANALERPVRRVSWYEAEAYCRWAGKALPTEGQWERACQAMPAWYGPGVPAGAQWEWTAEAVWKGGGAAAGSPQERCATRVPSYPALDGQHTGFRCGAEAPTVP